MNFLTNLSKAMLYTGMITTLTFKHFVFPAIGTTVSALTSKDAIAYYRLIWNFLKFLWLVLISVGYTALEIGQIISEHLENHVQGLLTEDKAETPNEVETAVDEPQLSLTAKTYKISIPDFVAIAQFEILYRVEVLKDQVKGVLIPMLNVVYGV